MSFDYRMVKCSRCGSTSALEYGICQRCGYQLKKPTAGRNIMVILIFAFLIIGILTVSIYLLRGTIIGEFLAVITLLLSAIVAIVGYIWLIIAAFRVSALWGLGCIFFPIVQYVFLYKYTDRAIIPFSLSFFSTILVLIAYYALPFVGG